MFRFERWLYVVLVAVILVWPGVRRQFILQIRQITHTTDVRVSSWPAFTTSYPQPIPVPMNRLQRVAEKHGLWEGLAELQAGNGAYGGTTADITPAEAIKSFDKALAADPQSKVAHARSLTQHLRQLVFYRPEEREIDERNYFGKRDTTTPPRIATEIAQPYLNMALAGEKLDPHNSYYDYALAYIYIGMHRDDEAIASVNRGWRKPEYNTHQKEASLNARQLLREAGVPSLEATFNPVNSFSHLARMRRLAVTLTRIAQKAESNGDWERGWELRLAAFRIGNQFISGGQEYTVPLVGVAIQSVAIGGLPRTSQQAEQLAQNGKDWEAQDKIRVQILRDHVTNHQLGSQGNWVISQYVAGHEFRRLYREMREMVEKDSGRYNAFQRSMLMWYGAASLVVVLLVVLAILVTLSLPRTIRTAQGDRFAKIVGVAGAALTAVGLFIVTYYALRAWSSMETPISEGLTWELIGILPAVIVVGAVVVLIRRGPKSALVALRTSARYALPVLAVIYVILSGFLAVERGAIERHALQSIEHGLEPKQIEILKKTGFRR